MLAERKFMLSLKRLALIRHEPLPLLHELNLQFFRLPQTYRKLVLISNNVIPNFVGDSLNRTVIAAYSFAPPL